MKVKFFYLFIFLISIFSFGIVRASTLPLLGKVIYIDAGHGRYYYTKTNINTC